MSSSSSKAAAAAAVKYGLPHGCKYASPRSRLQFLLGMSEVVSLSLFGLTIAATIFLAKSGLGLAAAVPVAAVGAALTKHFARGGRLSPYLAPTTTAAAATSTAADAHALDMFADHAGSEHGVVAIVTGSNSGIGLETVRGLALRGVRTIMAVRSAAKGEAALQELVDSVDPTVMRPRELRALVSVEELDLCSLASVKAFAARFLASGRPLHMLVCNAGAMLAANDTGLVRDAAPGLPVDMAFATNHLGHFLLACLLFPALVRDATRIVSVSSAYHMAAPASAPIEAVNETDPKRWDAPRAYATGKVSNVWFARALQHRLDRAADAAEAAGKSVGVAGQRAMSVALHPGTVWTPFYHSNLAWKQALVAALVRPVAQLVMKTREEGAHTSLHCALGHHPMARRDVRAAHAAADERAGFALGPSPGQMHAESAVSAMSPLAGDDAKAEELWAYSLRLLHDAGGLNPEACAHFDLIR